jgi:hypothetical protein
MKSFLIKLFVFVIAFLLIEYSIGFVIEKFYFKAKSGEIYKSNHGFNNCKEDILFFGASEISHHFISKIIEDSLNQTCYNLGQDGYGINYQLPLLQTIISYNKPKLIVISAHQLFNLKTDYISSLFPYYYNNEFVTKAIIDNSKFYKFKLYFKTFAFNSKILKSIKSFFTIDPEYNGYSPLFGGNKNLKLVRARNSAEISTTSMNQFRKFIENSKIERIKLIVLNPPRYEIPFNESNSYSIDSFCKSNNLSYFDFSKDTSFLNHPEIFKDAGHLNHIGALILTNKFIQKIKYQDDSLKSK